MSAPDYRRFPVRCRFDVESNLSLFVFSSYPEENLRYPEIEGREVALIRSSGEVLWWICPESGETRKSDYTFDKSIVSINPFIKVSRVGRETFAHRPCGDVFVVELQTGKANFAFWEKN